MAGAAQVVTEWAARLDAGDLDGSSAYVAGDVEWANPVAVVHGRDELRGLLEVFWTAIPDFRHEISDMVESGDLVAVRGNATGTHSGPLVGPMGEVPASDRSISFPFAAWARVEQGLIREFRGYWDLLGFLQQIGALPEAAASASS
jgi:steroid delta-isomerase-like uncharacterized protein